MRRTVLSPIDAALQDEHWAETIILVGSTVLPSTVGGLL